LAERDRQLKRSTRQKPADQVTASIASDRRRSRGQDEAAPARTLWAAKLGISR
jgi:hypothetical protein